MKQPAAPDVLLCDMGDTLIRWTSYSREDGLTALRPFCDEPRRFSLSPLVATGEELDRYIEPHAADSLIEYRQADFLRLLFGTHGIQLRCDDDNLEWHYWHHALGFEPEPGVAAALRGIRELGVRLGIVSNTAFGPVCISRELQRHGLSEFFDEPVVTSARFGVRKPHPAILKSAAGIFGAGGKTVWYIGNSVFHDVGGATAAGLPVIWYNEDGEDLAEAATRGEVPTHTVSSWAGAEALIRDLGDPRRRRPREQENQP
ncbi:MAG: HAD family hydrolase [Alkalispirochaeta sp.]